MKLIKLVLFTIIGISSITFLLLSMFYRGNGFGTWNLYGKTGYFFLSFSIFLAGLAIGLGSSLIQYISNNALASPSTIGIFPMASLAWLISYLYGFSTNDLYRGFLTLTFSLTIIIFYWLLGIVIKNNSSKIVLMFIITIFLSSLSILLYARYGLQKEGALLFSVNKLNLNSTRFYLGLSMLVFAILIALPFWKKIMLVSLHYNLAKEKGINVGVYKFLGMIVSAIIINAALVSYGIISFVGLLVPNVARILGFEKPIKNIIFSAFLVAFVLVFAYFSSRYFKIELFTLMLFIPIGLTIPVIFRIRKIGSYEI